MHTLWACSVLAILPPMERMPPSGGFPKDLSELNLSGWAALIQDVAAGLQVVTPNLSLDVGPPNDGPTPDTGSHHGSGLLPLLLPSVPPVPVHGSLPAGSH